MGRDSQTFGSLRGVFGSRRAKMSLQPRDTAGGHLATFPAWLANVYRACLPKS